MPESPQAPLQIELGDDTLRRWSNTFLPNLDVWYLDDSLTNLVPPGALIFSRKDYLNHPTFQNIHYVNTYLHWRMPHEVKWLLVADGAWFERQSHDFVSNLLARQVDLERGLVFPITHLDEVPPALARYQVGEKIVFGQAAWQALPDEACVTLLQREQAVWDERDCFPVPEYAPDHIQRIANRFGHVEGANCLATVAECVTGEAWLGTLWMHAPEFYDLILRGGYRRQPVGTEPEADDVLVFEQRSELLHAAFCVGPNRFISKNGQSRFNPVRVVNMAMLRTDWRKAETGVYRRTFGEK